MSCGRRFRKNSVLYVLNNRLSPKWFYSYDSSVTRTQREMTHHLVAYVFRVLPDTSPAINQQQNQEEQHNALVLSRHASPGFLLVSYRRSGGASGNPGCTLPAIETPDDHLETTSPEILSASWTVHEHQQHLQEQQWLQQQQLQQRLQQEEGQRQLRHRLHNHPHQRRQDDPPFLLHPTQTLIPNSAPSFRDTRRKSDQVDRGSGNQAHGAEVPVRDDDAAEDTSSWQRDTAASALGFREKGQQVLIIWYFLQYISWNDLSPSADTIGVHMRPHWLRAAAALRAPPIVAEAQLEGIVASLLSSIFEFTPVHSPSPNDSSPNSVADLEQTTIRVCGHLFLRATASRVVQHLFRSALQVGSRGMDTKTLQRIFISLIVDLWGVLDGLLGDITEGFNTIDGRSPHPHRTATLPALVDDVLSIVYRQTRFGELRAEMSALLLDRQTSISFASAINRAFEAFKLQIQESMIGAVAGHRQGPQLHNIRAGLSGGGLTERLWSRRWLLEPGSVQVADIASRATSTVPLVIIAQFLREFGCIDISLAGGDACSLSLRTTLSLTAGMSTARMELALDGQFRVFCALPSGISSKLSSAGGWSIGDYSAALSQNGQSIRVQFFAADSPQSCSVRNDDRRGNYTDGTDVRRISLSLSLEQNIEEEAHPRDHFIIVQGTVYGSTYSRPMRVGNAVSSDRDALWNELEWVPMLQLQAGYVAL